VLDCGATRAGQDGTGSLMEPEATGLLRGCPLAPPQNSDPAGPARAARPAKLTGENSKSQGPGPRAGPCLRGLASFPSNLKEKVLGVGFRWTWVRIAREPDGPARVTGREPPLDGLRDIPEARAAFALAPQIR